MEMRYRNAPSWKMPIELKRLMPGLPLLCDPSHICGKAEWIHTIAQEAMDLLFDGLMVEVHPDPANAWSDAAQQLTPEHFLDMVHALKLSHEESSSPEFTERLSLLREHVDDLDGQLLEILGQRMDVVEKMGHLKAEQSVSTLQPHRWKEIVEDRVKRGGRAKLSEGFVLQMMQSIHEEAIRRQEADRLEDAEGDVKK